ncbi:MAG: hypothetical protein LBH42_00260 [Treponema sp.]|jgi:hypothetical protein|nr:hypothetical protein [Treponema sp.]
MLQFYFLSVFLNVLAGFLLFSGEEGGSLEWRSGSSLRDETSKLVVGIVSMITGILKILSPIEGDVPVIGDLIPALAGFLCGFILVFEYYRLRSSIEDSEQIEKIDRILIRNKKIIGAVALAVAALHFLFPKVLFL